MTITHPRILIFSTLVTLLSLAACSESSQPDQEDSGGGGGVAGMPKPTGGMGGKEMGEGGTLSSEGGAAGAAGFAGEGLEAGPGGDGGEGGVAGEAGATGAGGWPDDPDDCELPTYLQEGHLFEPGTAKPEIKDVIPSSEMGTVPYGTIVRFANKYNVWRCDHQPFCNYTYKVPSLIPIPETEVYWEPVYWQGYPPDGSSGEWVSPCKVEQWKPHGTCGGFYLSGDFVKFKYPDDIYAERVIWECKEGWDTVCDTQQPGTGSAWSNVSQSFQCYGY